MTSSKNRIGFGLFLLATFIAVFAGYLRWQAVKRLPVDYDELVYLPVAFRYQENDGQRKLETDSPVSK